MDCFPPLARILYGTTLNTTSAPDPLNEVISSLVYSSTMRCYRGWWVGCTEQRLPLPLYLKYKDEIQAAQQSFPPLGKEGWCF